MAAKLDPNTPNNDVGLYWKTCRRVDPAGGGLPWTIPEFATGIIATLAGTVVWNNADGESQVTPFEAGQWCPIPATEILSGATIDGQAETTTATGLFWTATPGNIGKKL
jgi:hypothetical protein